MDLIKSVSVTVFMFVLYVILCIDIFMVCAHAATPIPPSSATRYRLLLVREARMVWGITAPVASFAGQIHQESRWNPSAKSYVGAGGLAQFMPATATWISGLYRKELGDNQPYNPAWAIRAMVRYDDFLYKRIPDRLAKCDRMALTLRAYNGGLGYLRKESKLVGYDLPAMAEVCTKFRRQAACRENLGYPRRIFTLEPIYVTWGPGSC